MSQGWVGILCPFPGCTDNSWHCGINLEKGSVSCWICGKHRLPDLIMAIEKCSYGQAKRTLGLFREDTFSPRRVLQYADRPPYLARPPAGGVLPKEAERLYHKKHYYYLKRRNFDPEKLTKKFGLQFCSHLGNYKWRIIVPFFYGGEIVTFTALDITGQADIPYKHQLVHEAIIPVKEMIYNIDSVKRGGNIAAVEGVTDTWRGEDGFIGIMGTQFTKSQLKMIIEKEVQNAIVLYDADAWRKGKRLAQQLSGVLPGEVINLGIDEGDPDELHPEDLLAVKRKVADWSYPLLV